MNLTKTNSDKKSIIKRDNQTEKIEHESSKKGEPYQNPLDPYNHENGIYKIPYENSRNENEDAIEIPSDVKIDFDLKDLDLINDKHNRIHHRHKDKIKDSWEIDSNFPSYLGMLFQIRCQK